MKKWTPFLSVGLFFVSSSFAGNTNAADLSACTAKQVKVCVKTALAKIKAKTKLVSDPDKKSNDDLPEGIIVPNPEMKPKKEPMCGCGEGSALLFDVEKWLEIDKSLKDLRERTNFWDGVPFTCEDYLAEMYNMNKASKKATSLRKEAAELRKKGKAKEAGKKEKEAITQSEIAKNLIPKVQELAKLCGQGIKDLQKEAAKTKEPEEYEEFGEDYLEEIKIQESKTKSVHPNEEAKKPREKPAPSEAKPTK